MFAVGKLDINTFGMSICCFATRYVFAALKLDICSRCEQSICCLRQRESIAPFFLIAPQGISSALAPYRTRSVYRATRQRRISTSNPRDKDTTDSTCPGTPKGLKIGQKWGGNPLKSHFFALFQNIRQSDNPFRQRNSCLNGSYCIGNGARI